MEGGKGGSRTSNFVQKKDPEVPYAPLPGVAPVGVGAVDALSGEVVQLPGGGGGAGGGGAGGGSGAGGGGAAGEHQEEQGGRQEEYEEQEEEELPKVRVHYDLLLVSVLERFAPAATSGNKYKMIYLQIQIDYKTNPK